MRARWHLGAALLTGVLAMGCSKGGDAPAPAASAAATSTAAPPSGSATSSAAPEAPERVVTRFLEALRHGDRETVASLLTTAAREETVRLGYEINPPGDPSSKYEVGKVETVAAENPEAWVSSTWSHEVENGEVFSFEAVWIAKREAAGWRVCGLAVKDPNNQEPLVFNFENLEEVFEKKSQAEQTAAAEGAPAEGQPAEGEPTRQAFNGEFPPSVQNQ